MWSIEIEALDPKTTRYRFFNNGKAINNSEAIEGLINLAEFRSQVIQTLIESKFLAYHWEVRPVSQGSLSAVFEYVLIDSPMLRWIEPDQTPFKKYISSDQSVVSFKNLRGDAKLIVPCDDDDQTNYAHMASFIRSAKQDQITTFFSVIGEEYKHSIGTTPKWLNTAGLGVSWLHARIDSRPKYYRHKPYTLT